MDFDISHLLDSWDYQPGQMVVRRFKGKDGAPKIQLRLDLGILQMHVDGRPDGKRPSGYSSLLEYHQARLYKHLAAREGTDAGFSLQPDECAKLQLEALQYHQRSFCLLQLEDYPAAIRDAERNLAVFEFVGRHALPEMAWALQQFQPQVLLVQARARGHQALEAGDYELAIQSVEEGIEAIRNFQRGLERPEGDEQSAEIASLEAWLQELQAKRPLSTREKLQLALNEAVKSEDYERAAQMRDALRDLRD